jgi:hypothetical protein
MTTPELAAKWDVDSSELEQTFQYFSSHHLRFVNVIAQYSMRVADPKSTKIVVGELESGAAVAIGVSPNIIAIILQVIGSLYPLIAQFLASFLGSIFPKPPAPVPVPVPTKAAAIAVLCLLFGFGAVSAETCKCTGKNSCTCVQADCKCLNCADAANASHASASARAALALSLALQDAKDLGVRPLPAPVPEPIPSPRVEEVAHECVCTKSGKACPCTDCDCNCPDDPYEAAVYNSKRSGLPVIVWVDRPVDQSVFPNAIHVRRSSFPAALPGIVVGVRSGRDLNRYDLPLAPGVRVTREQIRAAISTPSDAAACSQ